MLEDAGLRGWVCMGTGGCARVWVGVGVYMCVGEFSEFLLENRVPTSADFDTYPIRIFFILFRADFSQDLS